MGRFSIDLDDEDFSWGDAPHLAYWDPDLGVEHKSSHAGCKHSWKDTAGIFTVYRDCSKCGIKWEDYERELKSGGHGAYAPHWDGNGD